jgi:hypothetical protein
MPAPRTDPDPDAEPDPGAELFALAPEDFTAARDALVRQLRSAGRTEAAKSVGALRRPTVAAWAVNQVARADPGAVDAARAGGREVAVTQRRALSGLRDGGSGSALLRDADARRRELVRQLTDAAAQVLARAGRDPAATREDVAATFDAASLDDDAAAAVRAGQLSRSLPRPSGFGDVTGLMLLREERPDERPAEPEVRPEESDEATGEAAREAAREAAQAAAAAAEQAAAEARSVLAERSRAARDAAREAETLQSEAVRRRREADAAEDRADAARRRAERAAAAADAAAETAARRQQQAEDAVRELVERGGHPAAGA